jgi:hypothetical protein
VSFEQNPEKEARLRKIGSMTGVQDFDDGDFRQRLAEARQSVI